MPGALEIVKGRVERVARTRRFKGDGEYYTHHVEGLPAALERFVGKRVTIMVEEDTTEDE